METIQQKVSGKNTPDKKIRAGPIVATIWSNKTTNKDGEVNYKTISFERAYKDKQDKWQTTHTFRVNDLPKAILVLSKAYEALCLTENIAEEEA